MTTKDFQIWKEYTREELEEKRLLKKLESISGWRASLEGKYEYSDQQRLREHREGEVTEPTAAKHEHICSEMERAYNTEVEVKQELAKLRQEMKGE